MLCQGHTMVMSYQGHWHVCYIKVLQRSCHIKVTCMLSKGYGKGMSYHRHWKMLCKGPTKVISYEGHVRVTWPCRSCKVHRWVSYLYKQHSLIIKYLYIRGQSEMMARGSKRLWGGGEVKIILLLFTKDVRQTTTCINQSLLIYLLSCYMAVFLKKRIQRLSFCHNTKQNVSHFLATSDCNSGKCDWP